MPVSGYATFEGTRRFQKRFVENSAVHPDHYRTISVLPDEQLVLSSLGMGTYLGEPDDETDDLVTQAVLHSVMSGAVNIIDTAINYRYQLAERAIRGGLTLLFKEQGVQRDELFIASKNGYLEPIRLSDSSRSWLNQDTKSIPIHHCIFHTEQLVA